MTEHEEREHRPGEDATPPADRPADDMGASWVDPDDAAEEMEDETEGRS